MSKLTIRGMGGPIDLQANGTFQSSSDANFATLVGTRWDTTDGREFMLVSVGASATEAGFLYQDSAIVSNHQNLTVTAFNPYGETNGVANSTSTNAFVTVTLGATAATLNQYQGGLLVVNSSAGIGQTLRIASNTAAAASGSCVVTLEDGPNVALTTSSVVSLIPAHGANVVIMPTTPTNVPVGVALYAIPASSYGLIQTKGIVGAVSDATVAAVGEEISPSLTTAGTVTLAKANTTTGNLVSVIGYAAQGATSADASLVFVNL